MGSAASLAQPSLNLINGFFDPLDSLLVPWTKDRLLPEVLDTHQISLSQVVTIDSWSSYYICQKKPKTNPNATHFWVKSSIALGFYLGAKKHSKSVAPIRTIPRFAKHAQVNSIGRGSWVRSPCRQPRNMAYSDCP